MTQIRSLEVDTENIKSKQGELKNSMENELTTSIQALNNTLKEWITITEEMFDKNTEIIAELQQQHNRLDLNKRLIDEQSARLLNTTNTLTEVNNVFRNEIIAELQQHNNRLDLNKRLIDEQSARLLNTTNTLTEVNNEFRNEIIAELQQHNNRLDLNKRLIAEQSARLLNTTNTLTEVNNEFRNVDDKIITELQQHNNRLDLNKRLIAEQSARLLNTTNTLTEFNNEFRNADDSLSDKLINLEVQIAENNKVLSTVQDNYESLVIRSELVNQQVVKMVNQQNGVNDNTAASVEQLKNSLITLVSQRADKVVDDLRVEFNAQYEKAKIEQQSITTMAVESLRKEFKSLVYSELGYENIPGAGLFHIPNDAKPWSEAKRYCESKLGFLVELVNRELEVKVKNYVNTKYGISTFWLGARDHHTEGVFRWESSNQILAYTNWGTGEPNNYAKREDCAEFSSGIWNDLDCNESRRFICQSP